MEMKRYWCNKCERAFALSFGDIRLWMCDDCWTNMNSNEKGVYMDQKQKSHIFDYEEYLQRQSIEAWK